MAFGTTLDFYEGVSRTVQLQAWEEDQQRRFDGWCKETLTAIEETEREACTGTENDLLAHVEKVKTDFISKAAEDFADWLEDHRGDAETAIRGGSPGPLFPWP